MADVVDQVTRSKMMSGIRSKNTKPEITLRRRLHAEGLRYLLHPKTIPGTPDLAFPRYRAAVLVHGCFWHRHSGCHLAATPTSNADFWASKFEKNVARDSRAIDRLRAQNWRVAIIWECALRSDERAVAAEVKSWLVFGGAELEIPPPRNSVEDR